MQPTARSAGRSRTPPKQQAARKPGKVKARGGKPAAATTRAGKPAAGGTVALTVRIDPQLKHRLDALHTILNRTVNKLVTEALETFVDAKSAETVADLEDQITRLEAYRTRHPAFDRAFGEWAGAEARAGSDDPAEGKVIAGASSRDAKAKAAPARRIRELLRDG